MAIHSSGSSVILEFILMGDCNTHIDTQVHAGHGTLPFREVQLREYPCCWGVGTSLCMAGRHLALSSL